MDDTEAMYFEVVGLFWDHHGNNLVPPGETVSCGSAEVE